ncbi:MAG: hypothetical protein ACE5JD_11670 [Candidatus Methylomirabilia bacterium]
MNFVSRRGCLFIVVLCIVGFLFPGLGQAQAPPSAEFGSLVGSIGLELATPERASKAASNALEHEALEHVTRAITNYRAVGPGDVVAQDLIAVARRLRHVMGLGPVFTAQNVYDCLTTVSDTAEAWVPCLAEIAYGSAGPEARKKIEQRYGSFEPSRVVQHVASALHKSGGGSLEYGFQEILRLLRASEFLKHGYSYGGCRIELAASWFKKFGSITITSSSACTCSRGALKSGRVKIAATVGLKNGAKPIWVATPGSPKYEVMIPCKKEARLEAPSKDDSREARQRSVQVPSVEGLWKDEDGDLVEITQDGDSVTAKFYRLREGAGGAFEVGDESFKGTVKGNVLMGKMLSRALPEHDPEGKDPGTWSDLRLEISEDGKSLSGEWKVPSYYVQTGELVPESEWEWKALKFTREGK